MSLFFAEVLGHFRFELIEGPADGMFISLFYYIRSECNLVRGHLILAHFHLDVHSVKSFIRYR